MNGIRFGCVFICVVCLWAGLSACQSLPQEGEADLIFTNAKIVTVDPSDSIAEAMAVRGGKILRVGSRQEVMATQGANTQVVDLQGKTVLPGLIDSHTHPNGASMIEADHEIPEMETIQDVLDYVRSRAQVVPEGEWIRVRQVFITRLKERRYPTRQELDAAAPRHPVIFSTGPDASLNSLALRRSGIDKNFQADERGKVEKDPVTGEPTGIIRNYSRYVRLPEGGSGEQPSEELRSRRLRMLLEDYSANGLTSIADRSASASDVERYQRLLEEGGVNVRISISHHVSTDGTTEEVQERIREVARHPLVHAGPRLKIVGIKTFLDGGMLTGSAYLREPWGVSQIYSIDDPQYRGVLFIPREKLIPIVRTTIESGLQFTAHSVGDGAVHLLLEAYEEVAKEIPIRGARPCITHCNFMSLEAVESMARLGVVADIQPAWLYLDTRTLSAHFGYERLRYFQPLKTIFEKGAIAGGGSDHMQKIGSLRSVNPYNPFLGMWTTITRRARDYTGELHPEEALTRLQAIRFYTLNNAYLLFQDDQTGSLEEGKLADFVVLDRDILTCPVDEIREIQVLATYLEGQPVYTRN